MFSLPNLARIGWACFALDALAVLWLFVVRDMGDDAAGRGMATGFAIVLTPLVLVAGGALYLAQRTRSRVGAAVAALVLGLPYLFIAKEAVMRRVSSIQRAVYQSGFGRFDDAAVSAVADAIESRDPAAVRRAAAGGGIDWTARDARGVTLLGLAVRQATGNDGVPLDVDIVAALTAAGAPYRDDAIESGGRMFSDVVYDSADRLRLIDVLLTAGANPDDTERFDGRPLLLHHNMTVEKARILLRHGADLVGIRDTRTDRPGWSALMNATYMQQWALARLYLAQGCDPDYRAADGRSVHDVLVERRADGLFDERDAPDDYRGLVAELESRGTSTRAR